MRETPDYHDKNLSEAERIRLEIQANMTPKERFVHFLHYNFSYLFVGVIGLIVVVVALWMHFGNPRSDMTVMYLGEYGIADRAQQAIADRLAEYTDDVNGDGKKKIDLVYVQFPLEGGDSEYYFSILQKRSLELYVGDGDVMILSPKQYAEILSMEESELPAEEGGIPEDPAEFFFDISHLAGKKTEDGKTVVLSETILPDLEETAMIPDDYLLCMRFYDENGAIGISMEEYDRRRAAAEKLLQSLLK